MSMDENTRNNASLILQRLASAGQAAVAERIGVSESTVSRMKDGQIEQISTMLSVLGLKVVPAGAKTYDPETADAIYLLARRALSRAGSMGEFLET